MEPSIEKAVALLRAGGLVGLPTETVYGLAADAHNELAVRRIFAAKGRPSSHPLIVHLSGAEAMTLWAREIPEPARVLANAFWPGPLTLVLPRAAGVLDAVTGGQETVALRVPDHPIARAVLRGLGSGAGLAAPSANRYGKVSPTTAEHVRLELGDQVDAVLDGGPCAVGLESTIVDLSSGAPAVLRPGAVTREMLERLLGRPVPVRADGAVRVPGQLQSHYAPAAGVAVVPVDRIDAEVARWIGQGRRVAVLAPHRISHRPAPPGATVFTIEGGVEAMARELYARFRALDLAGFEMIVVEEPKADGIGLALRDRLARAASSGR